MRITRSMTEAERKRKRENEAILQQEVSDQQLLPNISNEITLRVICGKLPWSMLSTLSLVSRSWHTAIRSGEFFAGRATSHSAETFAIINHTLSKGIRLSLYSVGDSPKCRETLPPIPRIKTGIPQSCECITFDGKLYILGGVRDCKTQLGSANVYMLNLQARLRQWKKCASMLSPRQNFRAGIVSGKIYVCGGSSRRAPVCGTEVYNPEIDAWTALTPMPFARTGHDVEIVGGEIFVYGGRFFKANFGASEADFRREMPSPIALLLQVMAEMDDPELSYAYRANHVEVYNPLQNKWRRVLLDVPLVPGQNPDERLREDLLFMGNRSLHAIYGNQVLVFDFKTLSWTFLCSMSEATYTLSREYSRMIPNDIRAIQVLGREIFVIASFAHKQNHGPFLRLDMQIGLHPGVDVDRAPRSWNVIANDLCFKGVHSPFIRVLQL